MCGASIGKAGTYKIKKTNIKMKKQKLEITRRKFMGTAGGALAGFVIVPRHVLGGAGQIPPSEKVNIASIGAGGDMPPNNIHNCAQLANIVALCDVDDNLAAKIYNEFPMAAKYKDYRVMLEKSNKDIDGVLIVTPDHTHFPATMAAIRAGKHVYTQKPLTHTVYEARTLTETARKAKVMTQMGNQGHSSEGTQLIAEWIADGALGAVREVYCWTDRPGSWWPQGIPRPKEEMTPPASLDWDLWLGTAPQRPYNSCYAPFKWRGWWDFGCGALGDMGCHIMDQPFYALKLGHPLTVEATASLTAVGEKRTAIVRETAPIASVVRYEFPARGEMPAVTLTWSDGGIRPFRPKELESELRWNHDNGMLFVGEKASLYAGCYGESPRIIPEKKMREYKLPPKTLPRVNGSHEGDWLRSIKDGTPASSNFEYSGPMSEVVLLGNLAIRCPEQKLMWDGPNLKVTNVPEANQYVKTEYRKGWEI
jgi:predicted dehydrogenase